MSRIFLKLISIVFLISCSDNEEVQNTEIITDSYFFQKKVFDMNLYNCTTPIENIDSTYKKTSDSLNFYKFSELTEQDDQIDGCTQTYTQINELTPLKADLLLGFSYMELSNCNSKVNEELLLEDLAPYLEYLKENDVQVWTGISNLENNSFLWVNIWQSEEYREEFLLEWINSNKSSMYAKALKSSAFCEKPSIYLFL
tara:strand:+ start:326 stop:922 length:597 start_codon:yes stop_codon:yes gene_type:complete